MTRRSSSSRWSRPATGKQIAALKAHGNYDGKYYSMGRASQAIGTSGGRSSTSGRSSGVSGSSGSAYYPSLAPTTFGASGPLSRRFVVTDGLDSLLETVLGPIPQSRLASSDAGPTNFLSQILGVPDDIDSLVQIALESEDSGGSRTVSADDPVESVLYTVRSDDSNPAEPRIVVEAEVVHDSTFEGSPTVQIRFVGNGATGGPAPDLALRSGARSTLGYRPSWTPVLVRTPSELAEQMRVRWGEAIAELREGADPRMSTFLTGIRGTEAAVAVLNSSQSPASKFVHLQGLLDPEGPIQFQGLGLDAPTFAEQIRKANDGDGDSLNWLEAIQQEQLLTSLAEVTGTDLAAEADYRLSRWRQQAMDLVDAVTMNAADAEFDFARIRSVLTTKAELAAMEAKLAQALREVRPPTREVLNRLAGRMAGNATTNWMIDVPPSDDSSAEYGLLEDWFFEETRFYLQARLRQSLPVQFAAALTPPAGRARIQAALAEEVRRLADESSTDPSDYSMKPVARAHRRTGSSWGLGASHVDSHVDRAERIVQAVHRVLAVVGAAGDDDLGTFIVALEVLGYAQWKRDELRAGVQAQEIEQQRREAAERSREAQRRSHAATGRDEEARNFGVAAVDLERVVRRYAETLAREPRAIIIQDPLPDSVQSAARARLEHAKAREAAADEWLAAAQERERWAEAKAASAATRGIEEQLREEREAAVAEQADATAEQRAAQDEQRAASTELTAFTEVRRRFEELIRPVREENERRKRAEAEERRQREEEQRRRQAAERDRQEAANKRQEELNQAQQDRAKAAKDAIGRELERLLALPSSAPFWRRKALEASRASLEESILRLQAEIASPLVPPRTRSKVWPNMLSRNERYLGTVKKIADYGAFVSLPAGADGLLRGSRSFTPGQLVIVEIVEMPYGKPIVLKLVEE